MVSQYHSITNLLTITDDIPINPSPNQYSIQRSQTDARLSWSQQPWVKHYWSWFISTKSSWTVNVEQIDSDLICIKNNHESIQKKSINKGKNKWKNSRMNDLFCILAPLTHFWWGDMSFYFTEQCIFTTNRQNWAIKHTMSEREESVETSDSISVSSVMTTS